MAVDEVGDASVDISEDEAALYDRQIRLWGLDAQRRLRAANVFLAGLTGLGCEVGKNVILSGVDRITLCDHRLVSDTDCQSAFFLPRDSVGKNRAEVAVARAQKLNPMVKITVDSNPLAEKDEEFFKAFDVIVLTDATEAQLLRISDICHNLGKKFFAGDVFGIHGYFFADLGEHDFAEEIQKPAAKSNPEAVSEGFGDGEPPEKRSRPDGDTFQSVKKAAPPPMETVTVKKHVSFAPLQNAWKKVDWSAKELEKQVKRLSETYAVMRVVHRYRSSHEGALPDPSRRAEVVPELESIASSLLTELGLPPSKLSPTWASFSLAELSPVCAIVGGVLGGEVIKAVSLKDAPHNNFFLYDGFQGDGFVEQIGKP